MDLEMEQIIDQRYRTVLDVVLADSGRWLPGLARDAAHRLVVDLAMQVGKVRLTRAVSVEVSPPTVYPGRCQICIAWKAAESPALFPELGGVLELVAASAEQTRLSFEASYQPPARALGQVLDWALMHRVAEASVNEFVARIAEDLASRAAARTEVSNGAS